LQPCPARHCVLTGSREVVEQYVRGLPVRRGGRVLAEVLRTAADDYPEWVN